MNKEHPKYIILSIGKDLLATIDSLVDQKDLGRLSAIHAAINNLILANIIDGKISFIEINEYIEEALRQFSEGETPNKIKSSSIRQLLNS